MAKVTQKAALVAYFNQHNLLSLDANARSSKYVVYRNLHSGQNWYVGKAGAVRAGATIAVSRPIADSLRKGFIAAGKDILNAT